MVQLNKKQKSSRGYTLVEVIIYIIILLGLLFVIVSVLGQVNKTERNLRSTRALSDSAISVLERVERELRSASSINTSSSILGTSPGKLVLNGTDVYGNSRTVEFSLINGAVDYKENGVDKGALTLGSTTASTLIFSRMVGTNSQAIRTVITLSSGTSTEYRQDTYYAGAVLRGSL